VSQHSKQEVNWEFLLGSSKSTLQAYEHSRLNFAANLRKEIAQLLEVWVDESSNALLARWLIEKNLTAAAAADGCSTEEAGPSEFHERQAQIACGPQHVPKAPSRTVPNPATVGHKASDKVFGEKSFATPRIHAAS
jgi:hypothetical protein